MESSPVCNLSRQEKFKNIMTSKINFPTECLDDIFRHLSGKDLLECTLVYPEWNDFIGSTKSCMQKIVLRFSNRNRYEDSKLILINSKRKYECLHVFGSYSKEMHEALLTAGRRWTHVDSSCGLIIKSSSQYLDFLRIFESSVKKMVLHVSSVGEDREPDYGLQSLHFP